MINETVMPIEFCAASERYYDRDDPECTQKIECLSRDISTENADFACPLNMSLMAMEGGNIHKRASHHQIRHELQTEVAALRKTINDLSSSVNTLKRDFDRHNHDSRNNSRYAPKSHHHDSRNDGRYAKKNHSHSSLNSGGRRFVMQGDCNAVIYGKDNRAKWSSRTNGRC